MRKFMLLNRKSTWIKIFVIALGIAFIVAAWPAARCAVADCSARDKWCAADCSKECYNTRSIKEIDTPGYVALDWQSGLPFCTNPNWKWTTHPCSAPPDITKCQNTVAVHDQRLPSSPSAGTVCELFWASNTFTCCRDADNPQPTKTPGPCTPEYEEPTITLSSVNPPFPLTIGQDPESEGFDVVIAVSGGEKTNSCAGPDNAPLTDISLESVTLSAASITWIEDELSIFYPGAAVLDSYPLAITGDVNINESIGTLIFHVDPLDPGTYVITIEAAQDAVDNDTATEIFGVKVYLLETTFTMPGNEW